MTIYRGKRLVVSLLLGIGLLVATGIAQEKNTERPRQRPERTREEATEENFKKFQQMPRAGDENPRWERLRRQMRERMSEGEPSEYERFREGRPGRYRSDELRRHRLEKFRELRRQMRERMSEGEPSEYERFREVRKGRGPERRMDRPGKFQRRPEGPSASVKEGRHERYHPDELRRHRLEKFRELRRQMREQMSEGEPSEYERFKEGRPGRYRSDELRRHRLEKFRELRRQRCERMSEGKTDKAGDFQRNPEERRNALRRKIEGQREETTPESPGATTK